MVDGKNFRLADEVRSILRRAGAVDGLLCEISVIIVRKCGS
jgi:hypothetical protein